MMGWGDELLAAGQARRLHEQTGDAVAIIGARGEIRWHAAWENMPWIVRPSRGIPDSRVYLRNYPGCRPYCQPHLTREEGYRWSGWRVRDNPPALVLSAAERRAGIDLRARIGPYVLCDPHGEPVKFPNRTWGAARFARLPELLPGVAFVHACPPGASTPKGFHSVPTVDFRAAAGLLASAVAYVGNQGGLVHAAAALGVRAVVIFGGAEPADLMGYPRNINLSDPSGAPACGRILPCDHCRAAMDRITPEDVARAIRRLTVSEPMPEENP